MKHENQFTVSELIEYLKLNFDYPHTRDLPVTIAYDNGVSWPCTRYNVFSIRNDEVMFYSGSEHDASYTHGNLSGSREAKEWYSKK